MSNKIPTAAAELTVADYDNIITTNERMIVKLYGRVTNYEKKIEHLKLQYNDESYIPIHHKATLTPDKIKEKINKLKQQIAKCLLNIDKIKVRCKYCKAVQAELLKSTEHIKE